MKRNNSLVRRSRLGEVGSLVAVALVAALLFAGGCATMPSWLPVDAGDTALTIGVSEALSRGITDAAKRTVVANYIYVYAKGVRSITGAPSPAELTTQLIAFIPVKVRTDLPELSTLVIPLVVSVYEAAYQQFSGNTAKIYAVLNRIATDLEAGAAPYSTH